MTPKPKLPSLRELTASEWHILEHALAWPKCYRNHYVAGPEQDSWQTLHALVRQGLLRVTRGPSEFLGGMTTFAVTDEGRRLLSAARMP